ncbi:hypothetical protein HYPSUDRAFT_818609 [Hypholoma sublateritium FD-334 SS-4]|uniref:Uncharacterized protein n=1 Tax=Hypholoma sublateritium (strain FD-334 SS-4) TaxID=945553 RepID=A0A0D2NNL1_HYPSF|nr:hypothetical protein HYPSUDRAFT_818609 [Hypholoma sublateritium FD-334 SS-4]
MAAERDAPAGGAAGKERRDRALGCGMAGGLELGHGACAAGCAGGGDAGVLPARLSSSRVLGKSMCERGEANWNVKLRDVLGYGMRGVLRRVGITNLQVSVPGDRMGECAILHVQLTHMARMTGLWVKVALVCGMGFLTALRRPRLIVIVVDEQERVGTSWPAHSAVHFASA